MTAAMPVLCICGPSAAGKTTFALALAEALRQEGRHPLLITCDNYYRQGWQPHPRFGFDTLAAIDEEALRRDVSSARYGQAEMLRHYDMRTRLVTCRPVTTPYDMVLIEGAYGPQLLQDFPLVGLLYVETPLSLRLWRRLKRDVRERHRSPFYVVRQMLLQMLPGERRFILPMKALADDIIQVDNYDLEPILSRLDGRLVRQR